MHRPECLSLALTSLWVPLRLCFLGLEAEAMPQAQRPLTHVGCGERQSLSRLSSHRKLCLLIQAPRPLPAVGGPDQGGEDLWGDFHPPQAGS